MLWFNLMLLIWGRISWRDLRYLLLLMLHLMMTLWIYRATPLVVNVMVRGGEMVVIKLSSGWVLGQVTSSP